MSMPNTLVFLIFGDLTVGSELPLGFSMDSFLLMFRRDTFIPPLYPARHLYPALFLSSGVLCPLSGEALFLRFILFIRFAY